MKVVVSKRNNILYEANVSDEDLLNDGEIFLGREEDCHFVLDSYLISRHHAVLKINGNQLEIESLSLQGVVKVDGVEVKVGCVGEGSKIEIGDYEIVISELGSIHDQQNDDIIEEEVVAEELNDFEDDSVIEDLDETLILPTPDEQLEDNDDLLLVSIVDSNEVVLPESVTEDDDDLLADLVADTDVDTEEGLESGGLDSGDPFLDDDLESDDNAEESEIDQDISEETLDELDSEEPEDNNLSEESDDFSNDSFDTDDEFGGDEDNDFSDGQDDGFGDGEDDDGDHDSSTQVLQSFASYSLKIFGEYAPFDSYSLVDTETFVGRDSDKCQIVLNDSEVSKVHAVIRKSLINCAVEDLGSSNGIILNGERVNKAELSDGDEFIIGETTFTVSIESDIIEAERGRLMPVEANQEIEIVEEVEEEVDFDEFSGEGLNGLGEEEEKSFLKRIWNNPKKRKLYLGVGAMLLALVLFDSGSDKKDKKESKKNKKKLTNLKNVKSKYSPEQLNVLEQDYALALSQYENGQFNEAMVSLDSVLKIDPNYKKTRTLKKLLQEGLDEIARLKQQEQEDKERKERQVKVANYLEKAKVAVKERNIPTANNFFALIFELDPENPDVPSLKIEIEAYQAEELRKKQVIEIEKARRNSLVEKLAPGKALYIKKDYYKAIDRLEKFIDGKDIDEDLLKDATSMLITSRNKLKNIIGPLTSKARSFKEGQDLKQSYETYGDVLKIEPSNEEALNQRDLIVDTLRTRSMKTYREALIAESLSLFQEAKEKFQEVQQISPINSEYYIKATDKLKNYLE
jgi:pSer/pThr/pTyr-binding forkhead associated (FHA) protein